MEKSIVLIDGVSIRMGQKYLIQVLIVGRCPKCGWKGETRPYHYVDSLGNHVEMGIYCPERFIPDKNGVVEGCDEP